MSAAPAPIVETIMDPTPSAAPADDAVVQGFGSNLPLAMALRQIVPPTYRFSFGAGVNPGQRVSWQGGKKWSQIVSDTAAKNGLSSEISGNVIAIRTGHIAAGMSQMDAVINSTQPPVLPPASPPAPMKTDIKNDMPPIALNDDAPAPSPSSSKPPLNKAIDVADDDVSTPLPAPVKSSPVMPVPVMPTSAMKDAPLPPAIEKAPAKNDAAPKPVKDKDGLILPPPVKPLQDKLQDTTDAQSIVTSKADKDATTTSLTTSQEWLATNGQSLRTILQSWSKQAGVSLVWSSDYDYPLQTDIRIQGTYPDAVRTLLAGFAKAQPKPIGRLHNNAGVGAQPVLIIDTPRLLKE